MSKRKLDNSNNEYKQEFRKRGRRTDSSLSDEEIKSIEYFRDTYNAFYIENLSPEKKQYAINNNRILKRLVENLDAPKDYKVDYIEGPYTFTKFKLEVDGVPKKSFYLFGENHNIKPKNHCSGISNSVKFVDYIDRLSNHSPSFFDLYVELPLLSPIKPENKEDIHHYDIKSFSISSRTPINITINQMLRDETLNFEDVLRRKMKILNKKDADYTLTEIFLKYLYCIQPSTRLSEKCELMRIHNIDVRENWSDFINCDQFYIEVLYNLFIRKDITISDLTNIVRRIREPILNIFNVLIKPETKLVSSIFNLLKSNPFIAKELKRTYLKDAITEFIKFKIEKIIVRLPNTSIIQYLIDWVSGVDSDEDDIKFLISTISTIFLDIGVLSMDLYALCRIFKEYKQKGGENSIQPVQSKNIIIYAGNHHIKNYVDFLENYVGAVKTYFYKNKNNSCVKTRYDLNDPPIMKEEDSEEESEEEIERKEEIDVEIEPIEEATNICSIQ